MALNASIPELVGQSMAPKANSVFQGIGAAINIAGPLIGAGFYRNFKMESIFLTEGIAFIVAGIAACFLLFPSDIDKKTESFTFAENVKEVFSFINKQPVLKFLFIAAVILNTVLYPMLYLVMNFIAYNILHLTEYQLSLIQAAIAVGTIVGAAFIMTRKSSETIMKRIFVLLKMQAVLISLWFFPILAPFKGLSKNKITAIYMVLVLLYTMLNKIQNIPLITHFQLSVPKSLRGRLFGVFLTAQNISIPIGMWIYGMTLSKIHWTYIPLVSGIIVFMICVVMETNQDFKEFVKNI